MLRFLSVERIEGNILQLAAMVGVKAEHPREAYAQSLNRFQRIPVLPAGDQPRAIFETERAEYARHFAYFRKQLGPQGEDAQRIPSEERVQKRLDDALLALDAFDRRVGTVTRLLVAQVVMLRSPRSEGGSSAPDTLGTVWMRPAADWTAREFADGLWRETTHQALLLEDLCWPLFVPSADDFSALHSACVAVALSDWLYWNGRRQKAQELLHGAFVTTQELRARVQQLTPHGTAVLGNMEDELGTAAETLEARVG